MYYNYLNSPIGRLLVVIDSVGIRQIDFENSRYPTVIQPNWQNSPYQLKNTCDQLCAYFAGEIQEFNLPLNPVGTTFQKKVWDELRKIPYGETISYGEQARRVGNFRASRAVGAANGRNPLPIVIPCHRVIGKNGSLTGFGGGIEVKQNLLALEYRFKYGEKNSV